MVGTGELRDVVDDRAAVFAGRARGSRPVETWNVNRKISLSADNDHRRTRKSADCNWDDVRHARRRSACTEESARGIQVSRRVRLPRLSPAGLRVAIAASGDMRSLYFAKVSHAQSCVDAALRVREVGIGRRPHRETFVGEDYFRIDAVANLILQPLIGIGARLRAQMVFAFEAAVEQARAGPILRRLPT